MACKSLFLYAFLTILVVADARKHLESNDASVIIVGAGVAGIMAAKTLSEAGVKDFIILEATNTVGGRMREQDFEGVKVPAGSTWVVGMNETTTNPVWKLVQKYDMKASVSVFTNLSNNIYDKSGWVDPSVSQPSYQFHQDQEAFLEDFGNEQNAADAPDMSILAAQRMYGRVATTPVEMVLDYFSYDFEFAEPASVTSFKNTHPNKIYQQFGVNFAVVYDQRGFSYIAFKLAEEFLSSKDGAITDPRVKFTTVAKSVRYSPGGATVTTEDGKTYKSKYVIVTVSLGVLQNGFVEFTPALPAWKYEAINKLDICVFSRIYLKFPYSFWPQGKLSEYFLYADERRGYYPVWQQMDNELPGEHILVVTVVDVEAKRIEHQPISQTQAEMMGVLRNMFGANIPDPVGIFHPKWWSNKFFAGTNTNWPVDVEKYEFERVWAPIDALYFAGEHTDSSYRGNIQGAYYSGIRTAEKLLECLSGGKCGNSVPQPPSKNHGDCQLKTMVETA